MSQVTPADAAQDGNGSLMSTTPPGQVHGQPLPASLLQRQDSTGMNHEPDNHDSVRWFAPGRDSWWIKLFRCCCCLHMPSEFYVVNRTQDWKLILCVIHDPNYMVTSKGSLALEGSPTSGQVSVSQERTLARDTPVQVSGLGPAWTRQAPQGCKTSVHAGRELVEAKRSISVHSDRAYLTVIAENIQSPATRLLIFKHMCVLVGENVYILPRHVSKDNLGPITEQQYEKLTSQWVASTS